MNKKQMIIIGVVEEMEERNTYQLLKDIFSIEYELIYGKEKESMAVLNKDNIFIIIFDIDSNISKTIVDLGIKFNIVLHTFLNNKDYNNENLRKIFNNSDYLILNYDEENSMELLEENNKGILITYGFNNKATISLSSYDNLDLMEMNICSQRDIKPIIGNVIEPFEMLIKLPTRKKLDIYSVISSVTCGLLMDIKNYFEDKLKL